MLDLREAVVFLFDLSIETLGFVSAPGAQAAVRLVNILGLISQQTKSMNQQRCFNSQDGEGIKKQKKTTAFVEHGLHKCGSLRYYCFCPPETRCIRSDRIRRRTTSRSEPTCPVTYNEPLTEDLALDVAVTFPGSLFDSSTETVSERLRSAGECGGISAGRPLDRPSEGVFGQVMIGFCSHGVKIWCITFGLDREMVEKD